MRYAVLALIVVGAVAIGVAVDRGGPSRVAVPAIELQGGTQSSASPSPDASPPTVKRAYGGRSLTRASSSQADRQPLRADDDQAEQPDGTTQTPTDARGEDLPGDSAEAEGSTGNDGAPSDESDKPRPPQEPLAPETPGTPETPETPETPPPPGDPPPTDDDEDEDGGSTPTPAPAPVPAPVTDDEFDDNDDDEDGDDSSGSGGGGSSDGRSDGGSDNGSGHSGD